MQAFVSFRVAFEEAEKDKNGIEISHGEDGVDFDVVEVVDATAGVQTHVVIKNTVPQSRVQVKEVRLVHGEQLFISLPLLLYAGALTWRLSRSLSRILWAGSDVLTLDPSLVQPCIVGSCASPRCMFQQTVGLREYGHLPTGVLSLLSEICLGTNLVSVLRPVSESRANTSQAMSCS